MVLWIKNILQSNNSSEELLKDWAKTVSVRNFVKTLRETIFKNFPKSLFDVTEKTKQYFSKISFCYYIITKALKTKFS